MTRKNNNKIISVVHPICCGLDVHKMKAKHLGFNLVPLEAN
jgi:hypothetical protein